MGIQKECPAKLKRGRNFVQEGVIKEEKAKFQKERRLTNLRAANTHLLRGKSER